MDKLERVLVQIAIVMVVLLIAMALLLPRPGPRSAPTSSGHSARLPSGLGLTLA